MQLETKVGPQALSDGSPSVMRSDKVGATVTTHGHANYVEPAYRGSIFEAANGITGVAPGTTLTTSPPIIVWNPPSSGKNLAVFKTAMGYVSGTLGAGSMLYGVVKSQPTAPTGGTIFTPLCTNIGLPAGVGQAFSGSTLLSVPLLLRAVFTIGAFVGGANPPVQCADFLDGAIIIPPGTAFIMQGLSTAGTTPLVILSVAWEEIYA